MNLDLANTDYPRDDEFKVGDRVIVNRRQVHAPLERILGTIREIQPPYYLVQPWASTDNRGRIATKAENLTRAESDGPKVEVAFNDEVLSKDEQEEILTELMEVGIAFELVEPPEKKKTMANNRVRILSPKEGMNPEYRHQHEGKIGTILRPCSPRSPWDFFVDVGGVTVPFFEEELEVFEE